MIFSSLAGPVDTVRIEAFLGGAPCEPVAAMSLLGRDASWRRAGGRHDGCSSSAPARPALHAGPGAESIATVDHRKVALGCYLCAYQNTNQPKRPKPLPAGSPASPTEPLGACGQCGVSACSGHASRYGQFLCAICRAATAIAGSVTPSAGADAADPGSAAQQAAMAAARLVGAEATGHYARVRAAFQRIAADARVERVAVESFGAPAPNLVWDLAAAVDRRTLPAVREPARTRALVHAPGPVEISIDAVAGAVRGQFADVPTAVATEDAVLVVTGALVMAVTVAHDPGTADREGTDEVDPERLEIPPPWQMSHPILLSPASWLIATAYNLA